MERQSIPQRTEINGSTKSVKKSTKTNHCQRKTTAQLIQPTLNQENSEYKKKAGRKMRNCENA